MSDPEEIGFAELIRLLRRNWALILGAAVVAGIATFAVIVTTVPAVYEATARLTVHARDETERQQLGAKTDASGLGVFRSLLQSNAILTKTKERLISDGVLTEDTTLAVGRNLEVAVSGTVLELTALGTEPGAAAAIANTWAEVFVAESRSMLRGPAADSEAVLSRQLSPTRTELEELEAKRTSLLDELQEREEAVTSSWDKRISSARKKSEEAVAAFQTETRHLMEELVSRHLSDPGGAPVGSSGGFDPVGTIRSKLLQLVSVRAQLAQTPRVVTLEKSASDDTLADLIVRGQTDIFDNTLTSQEFNALYDDLAVRALTLESDLKSLSAEAGQLAEVSRSLTDLERFQFERAAGLAGLLESNSLEVRTLRRRRSRALEDLSREKETKLGEMERKIAQIEGLETELSKRLNQSLIARLLEDVEPVSLAVPAVATPAARSRDLPLRVALGSFLGGMLGLMIALFRSAG